MKDWKSCESNVAALLGGKRVLISGRTRNDTPDIEYSSTLSIECKSRQRLPAWLEDALKQAKASSRDGLSTCSFLHQGGRRYADCLFIVRLGLCQPRLEGGHELTTKDSLNPTPYKSHGDCRG